MLCMQRLRVEASGQKEKGASGEITEDGEDGCGWFSWFYKTIGSGRRS